MLVLALLTTLQIQMFVAFSDGTSFDEMVSTQTCTEMSEATSDPDKLVFAYFPPTNELKRIVLVICWDKDARE